MIVRGTHADELFDVARQTSVQQELFGNGPIDVFPLPAFTAFGFVPFTYLSYKASYLTWFSLNLVLLVILATCGWRYLSSFPTSDRCLLIVCAVGSVPVTLLLFLGQVDLLVLLAIVASFQLTRTGRKELAGAVLALALFKPQLVLGVVLLMVFSREWRALGAFCLTATVLLASPALWLGVDSIADQFRLVRSTPESFSPDAMANIRGFGALLRGRDDPWFWLPLTFIAALAAITMSARTWRLSAPGAAQPWALAVLVSLIAAPHLHIHSTVLVFFPVVLLLNAAGRDGGATLALALLSYLAFTLLCAFAYVGASFVWFAFAALFWVCHRYWPQSLMHEDATRERELPAAA